MTTIYPSLMSANPLDLGKEIMLLEPHVPGYHIDIMDNHFVPNLAFGLNTIEAIKQVTTKQLWLHAMVDNPTSIIDALSLPDDTIYSFHIESNFDKKIITNKLTEKKWLPSLAINPKTDVARLFDFIDHQTYQVLLMSVEPGFAGQLFMPDVLTKIKPLIEFRTKHKLHFTIAIDGGINETNIASVATNGVEQCAIASAIFKNADRIAALSRLKKCLK